MEKKQLKMYDAPVMEVVELDAMVSLLAGSPTDGSGGWGDGGTEDE